MRDYIRASGKPTAHENRRKLVDVCGDVGVLGVEMEVLLLLSDNVCYVMLITKNLPKSDLCSQDDEPGDGRAGGKTCATVSV